METDHYKALTFLSLSSMDISWCIVIFARPLPDESLSKYANIDDFEGFMLACCIISTFHTRRVLHIDNASEAGRDCLNLLKMLISLLLGRYTKHYKFSIIFKFA